MFCKQCGTQNIDTAKFCKNCGATLNDSANREAPAADIQAAEIASESAETEIKAEETETPAIAAEPAAAVPQKAKHNAEHMLNMLRKNKEAIDPGQEEEKEPEVQKQKKEKKPREPKAPKEKTPKEPKSPKEKTPKEPKAPKEKTSKEPKLPKEKKLKLALPKQKKENPAKPKKAEPKAPKKPKPAKAAKPAKPKKERKLHLPKISPKIFIISGITIVVLLLAGAAVFTFMMGGVKPAAAVVKDTVADVKNTSEEVKDVKDAKDTKAVSEASSVVLENATLATSVDPKTAEPIDKVTTFLVGATELYATVYAKEVSGETEVFAVWTYKSKNNMVFSKTEIKIKQDEQIEFHVTVPGGIPRGDYLVDFQVNGVSKSTLSFTVV